MTFRRSRSRDCAILDAGTGVPRTNLHDGPAAPVRRSLAAVSAYVISEVRIVDTQAAERYVALAEASITRYGGRYVARAAVPEVPEGDWDEGWRVVIVEFPTMAKLKEWHTSDD